MQHNLELTVEVIILNIAEESGHDQRRLLGMWERLWNHLWGMTGPKLSVWHGRMSKVWKSKTKCHGKINYCHVPACLNKPIQTPTTSWSELTVTSLNQRYPAPYTQSLIIASSLCNQRKSLMFLPGLRDVVLPY